ncbi:cholesterol 25-hydroxylase-like protein [Hypomesus transpacificus]|uniref:cholesterol 25-hydroxylase-like protein n=1 Tax=Hypomesus transpacificus TaxID=137520 RepID=UPI001F0767FF|nr:cholesterol 25-hydroxylase-like protein [Hypomesus transpacificus]
MVGANVMNITFEYGRSDYLTEYSSLQLLWNNLRGRQKILLSPYLPAVFAFLVHLIFCAPFLALETLGCFWPRINSYKITKTSETQSMRRWWDCFLRILLKYVSTVIPATALFQSLRTPVCPELAPSCNQLFFEVVVSLLLFDMLFFAWHYTMHRVPWLYRWVHYVHHQNQTPFALAAQDASPAELVSLLILALVSAHLVGCHPLSEALFHLLNTWLAVEDHCDYNLPWAFHKLLPCMGGAPFHQTHHHKYRGNYAPYFVHWDWLCGTRIT